MNEFFNNGIKEDFINAMIESKKSYIQAYETLFSKSSRMEKLYNKDLSQFSSENLLVLFNDMSRKLKYTTILSYNSLVKNYKDWLTLCGQVDVVEGTCTVEQLNTISNYKQYVILNDEEMDELTFESTIDGADYNSLIFMRLFWEIDGQESARDICKLNVSDIDYVKKQVTIHGTEKGTSNIYNVSNWLIGIIDEFSNLERISFFNRHGDYYIGTAKENNGFIFRMTKSSRTNPDSLGIAMTASKMSNILNNFCNTKLSEVITINDLLMSLALKNMVTKTKTPLQMFNEKLYFKNIPTNIYKDILNIYAPEKYADEYTTYIDMVNM